MTPSASSSPKGLFGWLAKYRHEKAQEEHRTLLANSLAVSVAVGDVPTALETIEQVAVSARSAGWHDYEIQNTLVMGRIGKGKGSRQVLNALLDPTAESGLDQQGKKAIFDAMLKTGLELYPYDQWIAPMAMRSYISVRATSMLHRMAQRYPQDPSGIFEPLESHLQSEFAKRGVESTLRQIRHYKAAVMLGFSPDIFEGYNGSIFEVMTPAGRARMDQFLKTQGVELDLANMQFGKAQATLATGSPPALA